MRCSVLLAGLPLAFATSSVLAQVQVDLVALVGAPLTGWDGGVVTSLNTPSVNQLGQPGFTGAVVNGAGTTNFVYTRDKIVHVNANVVSPVLTGAESQVGISNTGGFNFSPSADGGDSVYTQNGLLLRAGDLAPGLPGQNSVFNSRPLMAADGSPFWIGGVGPAASTTTRVLYSATPAGVITPRLVGGAAVGGTNITATGLDFGYNVSTDGNHFINRVIFTGPTATDQGVVVDGTTIVAREGSIPGGGSAAWQAFRSVDINNAGNHIVYGDDAGPTATDDILVYNGNVIVRQGDTLAGLTLGTTIDAAAINNLNQIVQLWDLPGTSQEGLFFGHADSIGDSILLGRTGDLLDVNGDTVADYTLTDFNGSSTISNPIDLGDGPKIYVDVDLIPIGGTAAVEAIIAFTVPEPGSAALAGIAALQLL
ncbi:MAG TPA: hypothetical protein PLD59_04175, partial [Tepidisphaeraceae bacterium]|nr:hypothetical protein [Tepidisphaeraceae bacterium]